MCTAEIQGRLKSLFDATKTINSLTTQLARWTPEGSTDAPSTSLSRSASSLTQSNPPLSRSTSSLSAPADRVALAADIHQRLKDLEDDFDLLSADAADIAAAPARRLDATAENQRLSITTQTQRLQEDIGLARSQFRRAQLQAKRTADAAQRKERQQLFSGLASADSDSPSHPRRQRRAAAAAADSTNGEAQLRDAANDVTAALRRTHQHMQAELHRSEFARATLQRSNQALQTLNQSYSSLDDFLKTSRRLIHTLSTSNKSDTWYLETALCILAATIAWLFFRRVLFGPIRYFVYLPTKWALQLLSAIANLVLGLFAGAVASDRASPVSSLQNTQASAQHSIATAKAPRRDPNLPQPSMNVGGGGTKGAAAAASAEGQKASADAAPQSLMDKVADMAQATHDKESQTEHQESQQAHQHVTVLRDRRPDEPVNPKKRQMQGPEKDEL